MVEPQTQPPKPLGFTSTITPMLVFPGNAREAILAYCDIFPNATIGDVTFYQSANQNESKMAAGDVSMVRFRLNGTVFVAANVYQAAPFSAATSFAIDCETQADVDHFWDRLSEGGTECYRGWLKDRFGMIWQVVPKQFGELLRKGHAKQREAVVAAWSKMKKIDIAVLQAEFDRTAGHLTVPNYTEPDPAEHNASYLDNISPENSSLDGATSDDGELSDDMLGAAKPLDAMPIDAGPANTEMNRTNAGPTNTQTDGLGIVPVVNGYVGGGSSAATESATSSGRASVRPPSSQDDA